jgi:polyisoprenoid-binding protein YceI
LTGNLTIRDITKVVKFDVVYGGITKDPWGNMRSGFTATTEINRFDYNVKYDPTGLAVAKDVKLTLNLEFVQGK